jgi:hypothetical protein
VAWLAGLAGVVAVARWVGLIPGTGAEQAPLLLTDVLVFACTVFPVWLYSTVREAGQGHAGPGKRRTGLRVVVDEPPDHTGATPADPSGPGLARAALRNAVKWAPWQLAHLAVARAILGTDDWVTTAIAYGLSLVLPVVSLGMAWRDPRQRALHDRVAGTRVVVV